MPLLRAKWSGILGQSSWNAFIHKLLQKVTKKFTQEEEKGSRGKACTITHKNTLLSSYLKSAVFTQREKKEKEEKVVA